MGPARHLLFLFVVASLISFLGCNSVSQSATTTTMAAPSADAVTPLAAPAAAQLLYGSRGMQVWGARLQNRQVTGIGGVNWGNAAPAFSQGQLVDVAPDPKGRFVFALYQRYSSGINVLGIDSVAAFTIDRASGSLTLVEGGPYPTAVFPTGMAIDPSGSFVYISANNSIQVWSVDQQSGALTQTGSVPATGWRLWVTPDGGTLVHAGNGRVSTFAIDAATGRLTPANSLAVLYADCITGSAAGRFLYTWIPGWMPNRGYAVLKLGDNRDLTLTKSVDLTNSPVLSISPSRDGKFAYFAGGPAPDSGSVTVFGLDPASGAPVKQVGAAITSAQPAFAALDFDGRTLYVSSDRWRAYAVNADGTLAASSSSDGRLDFFRLAR
ncbi:MAG TPA: beta-propeller fold lactonase family protein [Terriglobales bacterium]|nr:beta-propeller fold lactonase family protein [Terriglobales bacterium]